MLKKVLNHTKILQDIPNVPFLVEPIRKYLKLILKKNHYNFIDNRYSLVVNTIKNPNKPKLIIMAHTDHPGIIIKNKNQGIAVGTLETDRLKKILAKKIIKLKIFNPNGKYIGIGGLLGIDKNNRDVSLDINFDIPSNSFGQYDMDYFNINKDLISAYTLDDTISVAIMLSLLEDKLTSIYDVYFVFNLYEEVHQISAWNLAKTNILNVRGKDIILNLESQKVENIDAHNYPIATYLNGPIIQLSNKGCLFGYKVNGDNNAEKLVKYAANKIDIKLQTGIVMDSDDSRPFSYFPLTANIVSLNIPNRFKHNVGSNGEITPEVVFSKDVENIYKLLSFIIQNKNNFNNEVSLAAKIKKNDKITNIKLIEDKALLNNRLGIAYKSVIDRGYFYPLDTNDYIYDIFCKIGFYLTYYLQKTNIVK